MYNITVYESLSEKIHLIGRHRKDTNIVEMKLRIHHGAPTVDEFYKMKNTKELIHTSTKYINIFVYIYGGNMHNRRIGMEAELGLLGYPPFEYAPSIDPKDIEDIIHYLHEIDIINQIDDTVSLQNRKTGNLQYVNLDNGDVQINFHDEKKMIAESCRLTLNNEIKLLGDYDPTILLGLCHAADDFISHNRK